jgi:hypothetical protein
MNKRRHLNYRDAELLHLIRSKDEQASAFFMNKLIPPLKKYLKSIRQYSRDKDIELSSRVLTAIILMKDEPVLTSSLLTFGISIAKNQLGSESQKIQDVNKPAQFFDELPSDYDIYEVIEKIERKILVNKSLNMISDKCRRILQHFCKEIRTHIAAEEMGFSSAKVYLVKKSECLKKLKEIMMEAPEFPELFNDYLKNGHERA